jgi:hypothetical protein
MPNLVEEDEGRAIEAAYTPDVSVPEEARLICLAVRWWQIWR